MSQQCRVISTRTLAARTLTTVALRLWQSINDHLSCTHATGASKRRQPKHRRSLPGAIAKPSIIKPPRSQGKRQSRLRPSPSPPPASRPVRCRHACRPMLLLPPSPVWPFHSLLPAAPQVPFTCAVRPTSAALLSPCSPRPPPPGTIPGPPQCPVPSMPSVLLAPTAQT